MIVPPASFGLFKQNKLLRNSLLAAVVGMSVITLNGCQSTLTSSEMPKEAQYWYGMQSLLHRVQHIKMSGRANFAHGSERFATTFVYDGTAANNYTLDLRSSLGTRIANLVVTPYEAVLQADGKEYRAPTASALFKQTLDMSLPLDHFHEILLGIALERSKFNENAVLYESYTGDFKIVYRDFKSYGQIALPSDIEITGPNLRLIVLPRAVQQLEFKASNTKKPNQVSVDYTGTAGSYDPGTAATLNTTDFGTTNYTRNSDTASMNPSVSYANSSSSTATTTPNANTNAATTGTATSAGTAGALAGATAAGAASGNIDPWDNPNNKAFNKALKQAKAIDAKNAKATKALDEGAASNAPTQSFGDPWDDASNNKTKSPPTKANKQHQSANIKNGPTKAGVVKPYVPNERTNAAPTKATERATAPTQNQNAVRQAPRGNMNNGANQNTAPSAARNTAPQNPNVNYQGNNIYQGNYPRLNDAPVAQDNLQPTPQQIEAIRQRQMQDAALEQQYRSARLQNNLESDPNLRAGDMDDRNPLNSPTVVLNPPKRDMYIPAPATGNVSANQQELQNLQDRMQRSE